MLTSYRNSSDEGLCCSQLHTALKISGHIITGCSMISIPLNVLILWVYWRSRVKLKMINYLPIINLVLSDILSGLVGLTFRGPGMIDIKTFYNGQNCYQGVDCDTGEVCDEHHCNTPTLFCYLSPYLAWAYAYQNASAVAVLSVDRFLATCLPFWYRGNMTVKTSLALISVTWWTTLVYGVYHVIAFFVLQKTSIVWIDEYGRCMYIQYQKDIQCAPRLDDLAWSNIGVQLVEEILFFIIPVSVTIVMYACMIYRIYFKRSTVGFANNKRMMWASLAIITNSFIPWLLYFCLLNFDKGRDQKAMIASFVFFYVTPLTNPIIVSMRSKAFQKFWKKKKAKTVYNEKKAGKSGAEPSPPVVQCIVNCTAANFENSIQGVPSIVIENKCAVNDK